MGCVGLGLLPPSPRSAQTAVPANPTPEEFVPVDPVPPGNEVQAPTPAAPAPPPPPPPPPPTPAELIGYPEAFDRLGPRLPRGASVALGIVEGGPGVYGPNLENPSFRGLDVTLRSGPSTVSGHANKVLQTLVGQRGIAAEAAAIGAWSVRDWLTRGFLQLGTPRPPGVQPDLGSATPRVWSHSWIGKEADQAVPVLRRVDWAVDRLGVVMCVGVNNGKTSAVPPMLGSAFNVIAVGADNGNSSGGFTTIETQGRCKPDLVAPGGMTSFSTPVVAACAALLLDHAERLGLDDAQRPETIKAILMAGARKHHAWSRTPGRPLDEHLGAGRVHLDASLRILEGGPTEPGQRIRRGKGWAYAPIEPDGQHRFRLTAPQDLGELSVVLTWHRRIDGRSLVLQNRVDGSRQAFWHNQPRMADLDLRLVRLNDAGRDVDEVQVSMSRIDNVEHVYLEALPEGRYALEVSWHRGAAAIQDEDWTYALAWRLELPTAASPTPQRQPTP